MLKHLLLLFLLQVSFCSVWAQRELSPSAKVSVITCAAGHEMYSAYGHTAVRIQDPAAGFDVCFNYGVFDSFDDNFALKFAGGRLDYQLGAEDYSDFLAMYTHMERGLDEQVLGLSQKDKQAVYDFLRDNYKPENREYRYHFFFDNCSTRVRDMLETVLGDRVQWPEQGAPSVKPGTTFRTLIDSCQAVIPWTDFGIDIVLGLPTDKEITPREEAFLPDFLSEILAGAQLDGQALVASQHPVLLHSLGEAELGLSPTWVVWIIALLLMVLLVMRTLLGKRIRFAVKVLCGFFGLLGVLLLVMWFLTDHDTTTNNLNVLWANPLLLVAVFPKWRRPILKVALGTTLLFLVLYPLNIQGFHPAFLALGLLVVTFCVTALVSGKSMGRIVPTGGVESL